MCKVCPVYFIAKSFQYLNFPFVNFVYIINTIVHIFIFEILYHIIKIKIAVSLYALKTFMSICKQLNYRLSIFVSINHMNPQIVLMTSRIVRVARQLLM